MSLTPQEAALAARLVPLYRIDPQSIRLLHRGEGLVLEARQGDRPVILKLRAVGDHDAQWLLGRLHWIAHLHRSGLAVPDLVPSVRGRLVECDALDGVPTAAYVYARIPLGPGSAIDWGDRSMPRKLGAMMGRMHRLSGSYRPPPGEPAPAKWDDAPWIRDPSGAFHPSQSLAAHAVRRLSERLARLPRFPTSYGLIHDDLHTGNVFQRNGGLVVIDFDCCHYGWYAADLASALLFRVWIGPEKERLVEEAIGFLRGMADGYRTELPLPPDWLGQLPLFLKLREVSLYQSDYGRYDLSHADADEMMRYLYDSITQDRPFLHLPPERLATGLAE